MDYNSLYREFKKQIPESIPYLKRKESELDFDNTEGQHILFNLAVAPYILMQMQTDNVAVLKKVAYFMEQMEIDINVNVAEVVEQSIIEDLLSNDRELVKKYHDLWGPETKEVIRCISTWL